MFCVQADAWKARNASIVKMGSNVHYMSLSYSRSFNEIQLIGTKKKKKLGYLFYSLLDLAGIALLSPVYSALY